MSKFKFFPIVKKTFVRHRNTDTDDKDNTIRLSDKSLRIGGGIIKRLKLGKPEEDSISIVIAKDPEQEALLILKASKSSPKNSTFKLSRNDHGKTFRLGTRPKALYDIPNGVYMEDVKEPNVFVLID